MVSVGNKTTLFKFFEMDVNNYKLGLGKFLNFVSLSKNMLLDNQFHHIPKMLIQIRLKADKPNR